MDGDTQIKLRGIRIDLRDVEAAIILASEGRITDVAVSAREQAGSAYLVAYVVLQQEEEAEFVEHLQARLPLPQYMKPSIIVPIAKLPTNDSNKLDRRALVTLSTPENSGATRMDRLTVPQIEMKALWAQVIPIEIFQSHDIGPRSDFFHVGGTSLLLVNLQGLLREQHLNAPPLHVLFEASTLESMASFVGRSDSRIPLEHINWEQEADIGDFDFGTNLSRVKDLALSPPRHVVVTGATGFLGKQFLTRLLQLPSIQAVYCITIRQKIESLPSLFNDPRVKVFPGDLASASLNLTTDETDMIFSKADLVIHNGADVSFMKTYSSLQLTNVLPTKYLARLAVTYSIPFHFISSASVTQLTGLDTFGESSVSKWVPAPDTDGYTAAKWVAERHLEKIHERFGLSVVIHRPSSITGEGSGRLDLMSNMFRYVELLEAVPQGNAWKGYFDFISVHSVAAAIIKSIVEEQKPSVRYRYSAGEIVYPLAIMKELTESGSSLPVKTLPVNDWVDAAEDKGLDHMLAAYMRRVGESSNPLAFPKLVKDQGSGQV